MHYKNACCVNSSQIFALDASVSAKFAMKIEIFIYLLKKKRMRNYYLWILEGIEASVLGEKPRGHTSASSTCGKYIRKSNYAYREMEIGPICCFTYQPRFFLYKDQCIFFSLHSLGIFNRSKAGVISVMPKIHQQLKWTPDTINEDEQPLMGLCTVCCKRNWNTHKKKGCQKQNAEKRKRETVIGEDAR